MTQSGSSEIWECYVACQLRNLKAKEARQRPRPFVTISRQAGAGGITIGKKLVTYLNGHDKDAFCPWTLFDQNLIEKVLEEYRLPKEWVSLVPEDKISDTHDMIEEMFNLHPSRWTLVHKTSETILHLAQLGYAIVVGRGANVITRRFLKTGLHVRLVGSLEKRIHHIEEYYKYNHAQAVEFVEKEDLGRKRYLRQNFDKEIDNPLIYDLVINTDSLPYGEVAETIGGELLRRSHQDWEMNEKASTHSL